MKLIYKIALTMFLVIIFVSTLFYFYIFHISPVLYINRLSNFNLSITSLTGQYDNTEGIAFYSFSLKQKKFYNLEKNYKLSTINTKELNDLNSFFIASTLNNSTDLSQVLNSPIDDLRLFTISKNDASLTCLFDIKNYNLLVFISYPDMAGGSLK